MQDVFDKIVSDERYKANILYGEPRRGHAEGTVAAHIKELEANLKWLAYHGLVPARYYWKLMVLIHVHDAFKAETAAFNKKNCAIEDPQSHASLARKFLAEFTDDEDVLNIVQYHDIGHALYRSLKEKGRINEERLMRALDSIGDLDLFLMFCIIDTCTESKLGLGSEESIGWLVNAVRERFPHVTVTQESFLVISQRGVAQRRERLASNEQDAG